MERAACRDDDPDKFFPEKGEASTKGNDAIITCFSCPVRGECKDYKIRTGSEYGIWAGEYSRRGSKG